MGTFTRGEVRFSVPLKRTLSRGFAKTPIEFPQKIKSLTPFSDENRLVEISLLRLSAATDLAMTKVNAGNEIAAARLSARTEMANFELSRLAPKRSRDRGEEISLSIISEMSRIGESDLRRMTDVAIREICNIRDSFHHYVSNNGYCIEMLGDSVAPRGREGKLEAAANRFLAELEHVQNTALIQLAEKRDRVITGISAATEIIRQRYNR